MSQERAFVCVCARTFLCVSFGLPTSLHIYTHTHMIYVSFIFIILSQS